MIAVPTAIWSGIPHSTDTESTIALLPVREATTVEKVDTTEMPKTAFHASHVMIQNTQAKFIAKPTGGLIILLCAIP
jgi:hypothetical protein